LALHESAASPSVHQRMMADPVIRERIATDPTLQSMMSGQGAMQEMGQGGPGMDRGEMHRAMEFLVRLLEDPQVDARIHADPDLHQIWAESAVQRMLEMMRHMHGPTAGMHGASGGEQHQQHQQEQPQQRNPREHQH